MALMTLVGEMVNRDEQKIIEQEKEKNTTRGEKNDELKESPPPVLFMWYQEILESSVTHCSSLHVLWI